MLHSADNKDKKAAGPPPKISYALDMALKELSLMKSGYTSNKDIEDMTYFGMRLREIAIRVFNAKHRTI